MTCIKKIRVAVIGAGMMGLHHLRVYNMLKGVELVAVVDIDSRRAAYAAKLYGCTAYNTIEALKGKVDAVSIAVPSSLHAEVGLFFLNEGIHCLIEKPLAINEADCQSLITTAQKKEVILLVGHVEHFNPGIRKLSELLAEKQIIYSVEARRLSNASRILDVDVIVDLMVHDIEIISSLIRQEVVHISALGTFVPHEGELGSISALLSYFGGATANLTASKITPSKVRELTVTTDKGYFSLNYSTQELLFYREAPKEILLAGGHSIERIPVNPTEPLILEIQNFIQSIEKGIPLGVTGGEALAALRVVWQIQGKISKQPKDKEKDFLKLMSLPQAV